MAAGGVGVLDPTELYTLCLGSRGQSHCNVSDRMLCGQEDEVLN